MTLTQRSLNGRKGEEMIEVERIISVDQERRIVTGVIQEPKSERKLGEKRLFAHQVRENLVNRRLITLPKDESITGDKFGTTLSPPSRPR